MKTSEKLDIVFSRYIRARDCPDGFGRCISCDCLITPETCEAGHFIPRAHMATRWDENNVNAQCFDCNRFKDGNLNMYELHLRQKHGADVVDELFEKKHQTVKFSERELKELTQKYKTLLKTKKYE